MIVFHIPSQLQQFTSGASEIHLDDTPGTVGSAIESLGRRFPGVRDRVLDERGSVRPHVNVFLGSESIRFCGGLAANVPSNAEIFIVPAVSGG